MSNFRDLIKTHMGPPVKVEEIITGLGIELDMNAALHSDISGELERKPDGSFKITVNRDHGENRKRFTAAHELGHYMLHAHLIGDGVDDNRAYRSTPSGNHFNQMIKPVHETEANRFAAQLLLPRSIMEEEATSGKLVAKLAATFKVSVRAMEIRLDSLGKAHNGGVIV